MAADWVAAPRRKLGAVPPRRGAAGPRGESGGGFSGFVSPAIICKSTTSRRITLAHDKAFRACAAQTSPERRRFSVGRVR